MNWDSGRSMSSTGVSDIDDLMEMHGRKRSSAPRALLGDLVQFIEFVGVIVMAVAVAVAYHTIWLQTSFDLQKYAAAGIIGATGLTALLRRDGYYEFEQLLAANGAMRAIFSRWVLVAFAILAFGFAFKVSESFSRAWFFGWTLGSLVFLLATRQIAALIVRAMIRDGGVFARRIAIVGVTNEAVGFASTVTRTANGVTVIGVFDDGSGTAPDCSELSPVGGLDELERAARQGAVDDIVIASMQSDKAAMARLVRRLSILPVSVSICPSGHWLNHLGGAVTQLGSANVLSLYRRPLEGWGGVIKNVEDFVLGAILLVAASPVLLIIAAAIKFQDRGPVLFAQQRHGFNNSVFKIYKFRTMTVAEDGDVVTQAQKNDPRITPLGGFLRRYSLDELPQLINVVAGQMSLVGPRPHALAHNHQYARMIENYSGRHKVKPGITGWAQVNGYRGETSENELMEERVRFDLAYIDNWSVWFDFKILILTFVAVVFPKNAV